MQIWRPREAEKSGWQKRPLPKRHQKKTLFEILRYLGSRKRLNLWLVFSSEEVKELERMGKKLYPRSAAKCVLEGVIKVFAREYAGACGVVKVPRNPRLPPVDVDPKDLCLAIHFSD